MKIAQGTDMPLRGVYILNFGEISVKIPVLGVLYPYRCTDWGEIWHGGVEVAVLCPPFALFPSLHSPSFPDFPPFAFPSLCSTPPCQIIPSSVQHVALWGEKLHVMLLVTIQENSKVSGPLVSKIV